MSEYKHIPVLLEEVIKFLKPELGKNYIDATLGGGGYSRAILEKMGSEGRLLSVDMDGDAVENSEISRKKLDIRNWGIVQGNFAHINKIVEHHKFPAPDGVVADLGLSSYELEHRGMSFSVDQPLDMRFNLKGEHIDAKFILNNYDEKRLNKIFKDYGEEKFSKQISKKILDIRNRKLEIKSTTDLYQLIVDALPKPVKHRANDSARRIFQALRIEVNHELENLEEFLPKAFDLLGVGGRMVVVSFHSLEDRIVKQFFNGLSKGCVCPVDFPQCVCGKNPQAKVLTKKPITASAEELEKNPRANPAKLRAIVKI